MAENTQAEYKIDFIDPLFAVAVHIGLTHAILSEPWLEQWRWPDTHEWFHLFSWGLGFLTLVLSWLGYHESIKDRPLKGHWRFILDVLLVTAYAVLLVKFRTIDAVLTILIAVFALFVLWDFCKLREYKLMRSRRENVTAGWLFAFLLLGAVKVVVAVPDVATLAIMYLFTILYRVNKEVPMWGWARSGLAKFGFGDE